MRPEDAKAYPRGMHVPVAEKLLRKMSFLAASATLASFPLWAHPVPGDDMEASEPTLLAELAPHEVVHLSAPAKGGDACRFRDPEDGACYASADAADRAWLLKARPRSESRPVATRTAPPAQRVAETNAALVAQNSTASGELIVEDPDDPDGADEDGGVLAPVDASLQQQGAAADSPAKLSFWKNLARSVKGLVVRKADSKPASLPPEDLAHLFEAEFPLPVANFPKEKLRDSFDASRGRHRRHHAIDLPAPRGTPILAVVDGMVERMGRDRRGGKVVYLRDTTGRYTFYYAHLSKHAEGLKPGDHVRKGEQLGEVGSTGRVFGGPHLHFAIFRTPENETSTPWKGLVVNPYLVFVSRVR